MSDRDVVITGIGLVSCLGEGPDAHWRVLTGAQPPAMAVDETRFAPYPVHPLPEIDWNLQIPRRSDQRQMETWQRLGTYVAGLALDDAGMKNDETLCGSMDMIVAAGGGERDEAVDALILEASASRNDRDVLLNEKLSTDLRPTLFLAQLSNLLAGNISIVHKVTGSSRTFMGEEGAGVSAIETAAARIRSGQSTHVLVGGAYQCEHSDMLLGYELGGYLHRGFWKTVWNREESDGGGLIAGSGGAFLVLESRAHAEARGRKAYARIAQVVSDRLRHDRPLEGQIGAMLDRISMPSGETLTLSGASGAHEATAAEQKAASERKSLTLRGFGTLTGHLKEAQFPFAVALAALAVHNGESFGPLDAANERPLNTKIDAALATTVGYHAFEGAALVTAA